MKLAIIASTGKNRDAFAAVLQACQPDAHLLSRNLDRLCGKGFPADTAVAFVMMDNMHDPLALRRAAGVYPALPMAVVSHSPDFSLEAIRQEGTGLPDPARGAHGAWPGHPADGMMWREGEAAA